MTTPASTLDAGLAAPATAGADGLRIGIDARCLLLQRTGVERMCYHFIDALTEAGGPHTWVLFVDGALDGDRWSRPPYETVVVPRRRLLRRGYDTWITHQLPPVLREHDIDAFYAPHEKFPLAKIPRFTTIHGLEWKFYPSGYRRLERIKHWIWLQLATRYSAGIVTFATNTLHDLNTLRPRCAVPVTVVPEGVDDHFRVLPHGERDTSVLERLGIRPPFVLSVCSHDPRKNLDGLVRSFGVVVRDHDVPHQLVLVGRSGWKSAALSDLADDAGVADRLCRPGFVSDEDLVQLYNQAAMFVYPSRYEGFGLPLLEAMSCGVPVVTSRASSLTEVAGDAAILIDPYSDDDLAAGIARGLLDDDERARLRAAGFERVKEFSWVKMTRGIVGFMDAQIATRR